MRMKTLSLSLSNKIPRVDYVNLKFIQRIEAFARDRKGTGLIAMFIVLDYN